MSEGVNEIENDDFLGAEILIEDREYGSAYPVAQYVNGDPSKKKSGGIQGTGGFFISSDQGIQKPEGWVDYTLITSDGREVVGFAKRNLSGVMIRSRRSWQVTPEDNGLSQRFSWDEYEEAKAMGSVRGVLHLLFAADGMEEPILLSFRGTNTRPVLGQGASERGFVPRFKIKICGSAGRIARKNHKKNTNYPLCAFGITIGPKADAKGEPMYDTVGTGKNTSQVTKPMWLDEPGEADAEVLRKLYVGNERLAQYQEWYNDAEEWVAAWSAEKLATTGPQKGDNAVQAPAQGGLPGAEETPF